MIEYSRRNFTIGVFMDYIKGVVKKYYREYNRTLKDGTKKTYKTEQVQITIPKNENIFEDKEEVLILSKEEAQTFDDVDETIAAYEVFNSILNSEKTELSDELSQRDGKISELESQIADLTSQLDDKDSTVFDLTDQLSKKESIGNDLYEELDSQLRTIEELKAELREKDEAIDELSRNLEDKDMFISSLNKKIDNKDFTISDLNKDLDDKAIIIFDLNKKIDRLNQRHESLINNIRSLDYPNDEAGEKAESLNPSNSSFDYSEYVELQKEFIALYEKYEVSQEKLYDEKISNIHYRNLINKFKSFVLKIE